MARRRTSLIDSLAPEILDIGKFISVTCPVREAHKVTDPNGFVLVRQNPNENGGFSFVCSECSFTWNTSDAEIAKLILRFCL